MQVRKIQQDHIVADGKTIPDALRNLAGAFELYKVPDGDLPVTDEPFLAVDVVYDNEYNEYSASMCASYKMIE